MENNNKTTEEQEKRLSEEQLNDGSGGGHAIILVGMGNPAKNKNDLANQIAEENSASLAPKI